MDQELHSAILLWYLFFLEILWSRYHYSSKRLSRLLYLGLEPSLIARVLFSLVQFISVNQSCLFPTPWTAACQVSLSITNSWNLLKFMSIKSVMPSNHLICCRPLFLLPSIFPSIMVFSNESVLHIRWPKYWSHGISPSNEYSGLISCRTDWFDLLAVQGTLKNVL